MREIKFKYYFLLNKIVVNTKCFIIEDIEDINFNTVLFLNVDLTKDNFENMELYRSEYTGLKDKNGIEIYEGDIIYLGKMFKNEKENNINGVVEFNVNCFGVPCFCIKENDDIFHSFFNIRDSETFWFEVIGNIYENKDLLE